jgi:hypothetical protein
MVSSAEHKSLSSCITGFTMYSDSPYCLVQFNSSEILKLTDMLVNPGNRLAKARLLQEEAWPELFLASLRHAIEFSQLCQILLPANENAPRHLTRSVPTLFLRRGRQISHFHPQNTRD